jgi:hypothetical protein
MGLSTLWRAALGLADIGTDIGELLTTGLANGLLGRLNPTASLSGQVALKFVAVGAALAISSGCRLPIRTTLAACHANDLLCW